MSGHLSPFPNASGGGALWLAITCWGVFIFLMSPEVQSADRSLQHVKAVELVAGPDVHPSEWLLTLGEIPSCPKDGERLRKEWIDKGPETIEGLIWAGRQVQLFSKAPAVMTRFNHLYGDGGDRSQTMLWKLERLGSSGVISGRFNVSAPTGRGEAVVAVRYTAEELLVLYRGESVARLPVTLSRGEVVAVEFTTFGDRWSVSWDGREVATGALKERADKEGWTEIGVEDGGVTLCGFREVWLAGSSAVPDSRKGRLLYEETFSAESLSSNWHGVGTPIVREDGSYLLSHMSLGVLRKRFEGPLMIEMVVEPVFNRFVSAGVTDLIVMWMLDAPDKGLVSLLKDLSDAKRSGFEKLPFYWLDIGGTNNATTRFRKGPGLWLNRQLASQNRLLPSEGKLRLVIIQNEAHTEVHVNDEKWFTCFDPQPHTAGHIAFRGFSGMAPEGTPTLRIRDLKVWRID